MSVQWTFVAGFLYFEMGFLSLLMLPFIKPHLWHKLFQSAPVKILKKYSKYYVIGLAGILILLFLDGVREVMKYSEAGADVDMALRSANADSIIHMRLFRAQRNMYITGFALFLWLVIRRMIILVEKEAEYTQSSGQIKKDSEKKKE